MVQNSPLEITIYQSYNSGLFLRSKWDDDPGEKFENSSAQEVAAVATVMAMAISYNWLFLWDKNIL